MNLPFSDLTQLINSFFIGFNNLLRISQAYLALFSRAHTMPNGANHSLDIISTSITTPESKEERLTADQLEYFLETVDICSQDSLFPLQETCHLIQKTLREYIRASLKGSMLPAAKIRNLRGQITTLDLYLSPDDLFSQHPLSLIKAAIREDGSYIRKLYAEEEPVLDFTEQATTPTTRLQSHNALSLLASRSRKLESTDSLNELMQENRWTEALFVITYILNTADDSISQHELSDFRKDFICIATQMLGIYAREQRYEEGSSIYQTACQLLNILFNTESLTAKRDILNLNHFYRAAMLFYDKIIQTFRDSLFSNTWQTNEGTASQWVRAAETQLTICLANRYLLRRHPHLLKKYQGVIKDSLDNAYHSLVLAKDLRGMQLFFKKNYFGAKKSFVSALTLLQRTSNHFKLTQHYFAALAECKANFIYACQYTLPKIAVTSKNFDHSSLVTDNILNLLDKHRHFSHLLTLIKSKICALTTPVIKDNEDLKYYQKLFVITAGRLMREKLREQAFLAAEAAFEEAMLFLQPNDYHDDEERASLCGFYCTAGHILNETANIAAKEAHIAYSENDFVLATEKILLALKKLNFHHQLIKDNQVFIQYDPASADYTKQYAVSLDSLRALHVQILNIYGKILEKNPLSSDQATEVASKISTILNVVFKARNQQEMPLSSTEEVRRQTLQQRPLTAMFMQHITHARNQTMPALQEPESKSIKHAAK
jgi:hypothetical protein